MTGRAWMRRRKEILERDAYLCVACRAKGRITDATDVDHIVPLSKGGTDDLGNLQSLCERCHKSKSLADMGRRERRQIGMDGYPIDDC
jgi:5-methylcytosine-specific restriction protein A